MEIVRLLGKKENGFGRRGEAVGICMVVHGGYPGPARDGHVCVYVKDLCFLHLWMLIQRHDKIRPHV